VPRNKAAKALQVSFLLLLCLITLQMGAVLPALSQVSVLTQHNDNARTGANLGETILTTANVNSTQFGKLFTRAADAEIYAQPLYVPGIAIPGQGTHNVVYVATMNNTVYAYDADSATASTPLWSVNLGTPIPAGDVQCCCTDISTRIGILGTPVIDLSTNTIYLVSRNKNADGTYHQWLNALDITTGAQKLSGPREINATYGTLTFDTKIQNQRPGLLLSKGVVYIAWASHNDCGAYHGWVMGYDAATLNQVAVYVNTPTGYQGGIWQAAQGLSADSSGNIYLMGGNGTFDANTGGSNLGNSFIKLSVPTGGGLTATDYFTPYNYDSLNASDADLGASGVLLIPGTKYLLGGGKQGVLYLLDSTSLGHFHAGSDTNAVQRFGATNGHIHGSPIYYNSPVNGPSIYVWSENDNLKVFSFNGSSLNTTPIAYSPMQVPAGMPGGFMSVSSSGGASDNGIVWVSHPYSGNANNAVVEGIVRAFDASTIVTDSGGVKRLKELWNSKQNDTRDAVGNFGKFAPPTVAGGKVYLASFGAVGSTLGSGQLVVYGLLPAAKPVAPTALIAAAGDTKVTLSWNGSAGAASYNLYRGATAGGEGATAYKTGVASGYVDSGVVNGTTYYYQVTAVNAIGESGKSNEASATPSAASGTTINLTTVADAYVRSGAYASTNYGSDPQLIVKISPPDFTRYSFVKFDLSTITGTISSAKLRIYGAREGTNSSSSDSCYAVSDTTWKESTITWNNMPALGTKQSTTTVTSTAQWYEWDVTSYLQAQKNAGKTLVTLAVAMDTLPADNLRDNFNSKEAGSNAPTLRIVTAPAVYPNYLDFGAAAGLTLNGSAKLNGTKLELTDGGGNEAGSAFFNTLVNVQTFHNNFSFVLTNPNADGLTFTVQNTGLTALGSTGGGLGYGPDPGVGTGASIGKSVAIKFDLYNNTTEGADSTGIFTNGVSPTTPATDLTGKVDLHSGHTFNVAMVYDGTTLSVTITDATTNATATQTYTIDIPGTVGGSAAYVGFTGGTGGLTATQDILSWNMSK